MAVDRDSTEEDIFFDIKGIFPEAVDEFQEQMPEMSEGDYMIGGRMREDMKPFVYSGLVSEFPVNGETVFIVTERGEQVLEGYEDPEEVTAQKPTVDREEAYEVFNADTEDFAQAIISEELLTQYRRKKEQQVQSAEGESWENYLDFGTEMLNNWEQVFHRANNSEDRELQQYAEEVGYRLDELTEGLVNLADEKEGQHIESVRDSIYELEGLTEQFNHEM
ncbi:hypothetical protein [Candidatus Nanohalovita haloferacivicina]|uniref:hypothetical protein n=1 Tax=Candidatus Nanohalovita haloferacivicina TaxID=2978046 RepID=UPI00325FC9A4|nr:hypothetical protein HBNXNv_0821 [Candidatus Nanohalobia archaeon BNXNv]